MLTCFSTIHLLFHIYYWFSSLHSFLPINPHLHLICFLLFLSFFLHDILHNVLLDFHHISSFYRILHISILLLLNSYLKISHHFDIWNNYFQGMKNINFFFFLCQLLGIFLHHYLFLWVILLSLDFSG